MWAIVRANTDDDNNALAMFWLESNLKQIIHMLYIYTPKRLLTCLLFAPATLAAIVFKRFVSAITGSKAAALSARPPIGRKTEVLASGGAGGCGWGLGGGPRRAPAAQATVLFERVVLAIGYP